MRILFFAYNHIDFAAGGAQQMAHELEQAVRIAGWETHTIVALEPRDADKVCQPKTALTTKTRELSYFRPERFDPDLLSGDDTQAYAALRAFIVQFRPDVIHFHHFLRLGVEAIVAARLAAPAARLTLSFHEMLALCPANGQMVKPHSREICSAAAPAADCAQCVPERSESFYTLRAARLRTAFAFCDAFVFPSRFLAVLHAQWGLPAGKCAVIPHGITHPAPAFDRTRSSAAVNRFAFFGQMIDNKGVDVVLAALLRLGRENRLPSCGIEFQINGANRAYASPAYNEAIAAQRRAIEAIAGERIKVVDAGAYRRDELAERMARADWVIVPSTWGESFALTVSEAWMFGRPVIVSAIGALAERVRNGVDGYTFPVRDSAALATLIAGLCGNAARWRRMSAAIAPPPSPQTMFAVYQSLWSPAKA